MKDRIEELLKEIETFAGSAEDHAEEFRLKYLSRKGQVSSLFDDFKNVPNELKRDVGQLLNKLKTRAQERWDELRSSSASNTSNAEFNFDLYYGPNSYYGLKDFDIELENKRLRDLTADLQERLDIYQNSLHDAELVAAQGKRQLDEVKSEVYALRERIAQLEDELDLAKAKALQLHKAEATVFAYKKKLDSVGVISQQIQEMEDQSTGYLRQIVDLENDNKQIPGLQRKIETMQEQMRKLEMQLSESSKQLNEKNTMILQLRTDLVAAENAKKLFEDEVSAVRSQNSNSLTEDHDASNFTLLRPSTSTANLKERIFRVEHENESLKKQIFLLQAASSTTADDVVSHDIKREIEQRDAKINQLSQDKAKLEAYSKMTLAKFQEKYMVALQECKKQLKEKTEKIEQLEMRAAVEKAGHKREEQLLSSSIYELGLSIMQGNLTRK